jgi:hypothetical protein
MGLVKALQPVAFLKLARDYDLVHQAWVLNTLAAALPWFEALCGMLLLGGIAVRGTALMLAAMLVPFTAMIVRRGLEMASLHHQALCLVKFDCGCGMGEVMVCHKLVENVLLFLLCLWLVCGGGKRFCLRFTLFSSDSSSGDSGR